MCAVLDLGFSTFEPEYDAGDEANILNCFAVDDFDTVWGLVYGLHREARDQDLPPDLDLLRRTECRLLFCSGALDSARRVCLEVLETARREVVADSTVALARILLARIATEQHSFAEARRQLADAAAWVSGDSPSWVSDELRLARAHLAAASDDGASALGWITAALEQPESWSAVISVDPSVVPWAVRTALGTGAWSLTAELVNFAEELAASAPSGSSMAACALQARGLLIGDPDMLRSAAGMLGSGPRRLAEAEANEDAGDAFASRAMQESAVAHYERAARIYHVLGAQLGAHRIGSHLRKVGTRTLRVRRGSRPSIGWESLSSTELGVAKLVADGLTNRQIAGILYMSRYTVDTHLRHIFAKLGLSSRVGLTRVVAEHQALDGPSRAATARPVWQQ
jgi:DNA-binding CsgD family transcriptional regulator